MARDVYCDQELVTGDDDGTSWINAYRTLTKALDGTNTTHGDTLWVKGNATIGATVNLDGKAGWNNDLAKLIGCKSATTATPPANSDIIPGFRTGQSVFAYDDADVPTLTTSTVDINFNGNFALVYGLVLKADRNFIIAQTASTMVLEEVEFRAGNGVSGEIRPGNATANSRVFCYLKRCKLSAGTNGRIDSGGGIGKFIWEDCIFDIPGATITDIRTMVCTFDSCDFSAQSGDLTRLAGGNDPKGVIKWLDCHVNASSAFTGGTITQAFRTEFIHVTSVTGKTTGQTFQEVDILTSNGNIVEETTRFRTNGADDGGSGEWSLAFTPGINGTRDNYIGLTGPKMAIEVVGDGTAQTLTVYIANSSASTDYQDDEVWLVAKSPSEAGTADYDFYTTQMDLLASASNITDDTGSTWGSGANNHQKLEITLSPDYDGIIECWVVFAKNFGADPETLYVDPLPVLS